MFGSSSSTPSALSGLPGTAGRQRVQAMPVSQKKPRLQTAIVSGALPAATAAVNQPGFRPRPDQVTSGFSG